ncbi:hypothetical protein GW17_00027749, partial [Ensete ventricosum]
MEEVRRGPWTTEEDLVLNKYVAQHGEGRWNALARCAGFDGSTIFAQMSGAGTSRRRSSSSSSTSTLVGEIAQYLPGRTDNEIKNYWRTRVQKHANLLRCDVNSTTFKDAIRYVWMPRLLERIRAASGGAAFSASCTSPVAAAAADPLPSHPLKQPEQATLGSETVESSPSEEASLPIPFSCFADCHSTTMQGWGGWAADSLSLPACCDEQGGWPAGDLLSGESLWSMEDDWGKKRKEIIERLWWRNVDRRQSTDAAAFLLDEFVSPTFPHTDVHFGSLRRPAACRGCRESTRSVTPDQPTAYSISC